MRPEEAGKLLGGHAAGNLSDAERRTLYGAALEDQALFDALMEEEALRELLADPLARAQVLAVLAPALPPVQPKVRPLWRRPGVLGAAASLLMASLAGLTWLRSPQAPPPVRQEPAPAKALSVEMAEEAPAKPRKAPKTRAVPQVEAPPPPWKGELPAAGPVAAEAAAIQADQAPPPAPAPAQDRRLKAAEAPLRSAPAAAAVEVVSGLVRGDAGGRVTGEALVPAWTLASLQDGSTLVAVTAPRAAVVVLLKRGAVGVEVLQGRASAAEGDRVRWQYRVKLKDGDSLDLYLPTGPVADPAALPEGGPVEGFRARIHPAAK